MLKSVLSTITALTALSLISSSPASAAKLLIIKAPSHNVKVQPKVQPRVKLHGAKPRIANMPKPLIRKNAKVIAAKKITPNVTGAAKIKKVKPLIATNRLAGDGSVKPSLKGKLGKLSELGHIGNLKQDAAAAKDMLQLMDRNHGLDMSQFGLGPAKGATPPSTDQKKPDLPAQSRFNPDGGIGDIAGADSGIYGFLGNSHGKAPQNSPGSSSTDGAKGAWAVTPDSIANAMGGVAEQQGHTRATIGPWIEDGNGRRHREEVIIHENGSRTVFYDAEYANGTTSHARTDFNSEGRVVREEYRPSDGVGGFARIVDPNRDWDGPIKETTTGRFIKPLPPPPSGGSGAGTTQLVDPDSGHGGPSPFPWIKEETSKNIKQASGGKSPGAMTGAPVGANETPLNGQKAMFTQKDVLEHWDETPGSGDGRTILTRGCEKTDC